MDESERSSSREARCNLSGRLLAAVSKNAGDMTREIKFRAWDKEKKVWLDGADFLVSPEGTVLLYDVHFGAKYGNLTGKWREDEDGRVELVRFTGLKELNGRNDKDIYEGDIIECVPSRATLGRCRRGAVRRCRAGSYLFWRFIWIVDILERIERVL